MYYHGDPESNCKCPGWMLVLMCDQHSSSSADRRKLKDDRCAALAETPAESLEAVRVEAIAELLQALESDRINVIEGVNRLMKEWAIRQRLEEIAKEGKK